MFRNGLENFLKRFVVIYGYTMLATWVICICFNSDAQLGVSFFGNMIVFSLCADITGLVYISPRELTEREWWIRALIQLLLLEAILMPLGHLFGMWGGSLGFIMFFLMIALVDAGVHLIEYKRNAVVAKDLNQRLKERREEREKRKVD